MVLFTLALSIRVIKYETRLKIFRQSSSVNKAGIGVPRFKGVKATIRKTKKSVPKIEDLLAKLLVEKNKEK